MSISAFSYKLLSFVLLVSFASLGCDSSESEPRACQPGSTAWIRHALIGEGETEEEQLVTELLILGHAVSADDETASNCLYWAQFDYEGSILLDQGRFVLEDATLVDAETAEYGLEDPPAEGGPYRGTWSTSYLYDFIREPDKGILARRGAQRSVYPLPAGQAPPSLPRLPVDEAQPLEREIEFYREGNRLRFTVDGNTKWFEELGPLIASLHPDDPEELSCLVRMANLSVLTSQVRVMGFGGSFGATAYSDLYPGNFAGLVAGNLRVEFNVKLGKVNATLDYQEFSDIPGLSLDGQQHLAVNWSGDGDMGGSQLIDLSMASNNHPFASAQIDYADVVIKDGFADSGTLMVTVNGEEHEIDVEEGLIVDFRGLIPLDQAAE